MAYFIDLEEFDEDDYKIRLMAQNFSGDVKKWLRGLGVGLNDTPQRLNELFLARWVEKKNPLQILAEYNTLKINPNKMVQEFTIRFNHIYNSIPNNMKPLPDLALQHYPDAFDLKMS